MIPFMAGTRNLFSETSIPTLKLTQPVIQSMPVVLPPIEVRNA
jgi:hypothetical protein